MKDKIEVHKIEIIIGDKIISLKPEQAKELKKILNEMFEEKEKIVHEHHWRYWWNYPQSYPWCSTATPMWTIGATSSLSATVTGYQNSPTTDTVQLTLNAG